MHTPQWKLPLMLWHHPVGNKYFLYCSTFSQFWDQEVFQHKSISLGYSYGCPLRRQATHSKPNGDSHCEVVGVDAVHEGFLLPNIDSFVW